ncbi:alpha-(1,3)-fucosyltransferase B [Microplitis mediator]|uniref:alpha-(1,3)-fucosyltransferase B n=1 Tax=Microplitis mediator TaxID=375433 RepID=UPI0025528F23|nr:alpha-(1,3)-fucosyltransferase B [Microplitis mediator]
MKTCQLIFIFSFILLLFQVYFMLREYENEAPAEIPIVLWWTPFGSDEQLRKCGDVKCYFTKNRSVLTNSRLKAILFYGSNIEFDDLPFPRQTNVTWGLLHEESPRNNLILVQEEALQLFNYSATFSRFSDLPINLVNLPSKQELLERKYFLSTPEKTQLMKQKNLAPVLFIQSNCDTMNGRDSFVSQLMKYIPVDSYGSCINNKLLPEEFQENYLDKLNSREFLKFVGQYKFTLAIENAVCEDYITEKLWRPLMVGSVPIYYGSPSFKDWLPNNHSAIAVSEFKNPKILAEYLRELINDDVKYNDYLRHKLVKNGITNSYLLNVLQKKPKNLFNNFGYYVKKFECFVCKKSLSSITQNTVTKKHYNCSKPRNVYTNKKNQWSVMWEIESCAAKLLHRLFSQNKTIDINKFHREKIKMYKDKKCF